MFQMSTSREGTPCFPSQSSDKENAVRIKRIVAGLALVGSLIAVGSGTAHADKCEIKARGVHVCLPG